MYLLPIMLKEIIYYPISHLLTHYHKLLTTLFRTLNLRVYSLDINSRTYCLSSTFKLLFSCLKFQVSNFDYLISNIHFSHSHPP